MSTYVYLEHSLWPFKAFFTNKRELNYSLYHWSGVFFTKLGRWLRLESWNDTKFWDLNTATGKILRMRERVIPWLNLTSGAMPAPSLLAAKIGIRQHFWLGLVCCCGPGPGYPPALAAPNIWKSTDTSHFEGLSINVTTFFFKMLKEHQHQSCYQSCVTFDELLEKEKNIWKGKIFWYQQNSYF